MTTKTLLLSLLILNAISTFGQNIYKEKVGPCKTDQFSLEGDSMNAIYPAKTLLNDICKNIDSTILNKIIGEISIQVIVDTLGMPCVMSIENNLNYTAKKINIIKIINEKTNWSAPVSGNKKIKVSVQLRLTFNKDHIVIQRFGFNYNTGPKELDQFIQNKN